MHNPAPSISLSPDQLALIEQPLDAHLFLEGPAGCGKTTAGVERMLNLMANGVRGDSILLLVPQRTLAEPYFAALRHPGVVAGGMVSIITIGGLAQRMVDLFWPVAAGPAGFADPDQLPTFLTLETAQYYMAHLVRPRLDQGLFASVTLQRNRLYSQILDNLNKAALVGFPYTEIGERLKSAWTGEPGQMRVYEDVQACASLFRQYCLEHNLLDFSLQLEVFRDQLWRQPLCREYLNTTFHHLLVDNLEEDTPVTHDLLLEWLPHFDSALFILDAQAGYRRFLGADPDSAYRLKEACPVQMALEASFVVSPAVQDLGTRLAQAVQPFDELSLPMPVAFGDARPLEQRIGARLALEFQFHRYYPEMVDWTAGRIAELVQRDGVPPGEIVVLAPFLSDALRFSLEERLERLGVPYRSHRPSRALREESATNCLLTLALVAHPGWAASLSSPPTRFDFAYALVQAIEGMDLVRAQLLAEIVFRLHDGQPALSSFERIQPETQERITYSLGERYERLRGWLQAYAARLEQGQESPDEFDYFLSRLFGEVLSQPGFGFHKDLDAGEVAANLIESVQKFRWAAGRTLAEEGIPLGREYLQMVQEGVIAAQYIRSWETPNEQAVLLAPAYTFLMSNRPVGYQVWLDVGSRGWFERLYQPLTHPYVLSRAWLKGRPWTHQDELAASQETLRRLALGLLRRCRRKIYLGLSELSEQGYEERGPLLQAFQRLLQGLPRLEET